jgi:hypothetical protein
MAELSTLGAVIKAAVLGEGLDAEDITFDPTGTGLSATSTQEAIEELVGDELTGTEGQHVIYDASGDAVAAFPARRLFFRAKVAAQTAVVLWAVPFAFTVASLENLVTSGGATVTASVGIGSAEGTMTNITGLAALAATGTAQDATATAANTGAAYALIMLTLASPVGDGYVMGTLKLTQTGAIS